MIFVLFIGLWQNLRYRGLLPEELAQSMYIGKDLSYLIETYLVAHLVDYSKFSVRMIVVTPLVCIAHYFVLRAYADLAASTSGPSFDYYQFISTGMSNGVVTVLICNCQMWLNQFDMSKVVILFQNAKA